MYAASISMDHPVREVAFAHRDNGIVSAVAYLSDGSFALLADNKGPKSQMIASYSPPAVIGNVSWSDSENVDVTSLRQVLIVGSSDASLELIAMTCGPPNESSDCLVEISIGLDENCNGSASLTRSIPLEGRVLRMVHWLDNVQGALLELEDGSLLEYSRDTSGEGLVLPSDAEPLLEPCPWIGALHDTSKLDQEEASHRDRLVVGLSSRSRLYCHDRLLADAASSFILSPSHQFLCYATADARSLLKFLPFKELHKFDPLMGSDENHLARGIRAS